MSNVIYYFSGTGSNLATAIELSRYIPDTEIHPVTDLLTNKEIPSQYGLIGFTAPAYDGHLPPVFYSCLKDLKFLDHQEVFLVIGCMGIQGHTANDFKQLMGACGKSVDHSYTIAYPDNVVLVHGAFPRWYQNITVKHAKKKAKLHAGHLIKGKTSKKTGIVNVKTYLPKDIIQENNSKYNAKGLEYYVNQDCTKCESCIKICPVNNISIDNGQIAFGAKCQQCQACIQWCPQRSINYQGVTEKRSRYHYPEITLKDMIEYNQDHRI